MVLVPPCPSELQGSTVEMSLNFGYAHALAVLHSLSCPRTPVSNPGIQHKKAYTLPVLLVWAYFPPSLLFSSHRNHILSVTAILWEEPGSPCCLPCSVPSLPPLCSSEPCHRGGTAPCALHILPLSPPACYSSVGWDWRR